MLSKRFYICTGVIALEVPKQSSILLLRFALLRDQIDSVVDSNGTYYEL